MYNMGTNLDEQVQQLFEIAKEKKKRIAIAERPNWKTNCAFRYNNDSSQSINLQVCVDKDVFVSILAFLKSKVEYHNIAAKELGVKSTFSWGGFSYEDWLADIKARITKIDITTEKKELEVIEGRLSKLISPELKTKLEIEEITRILSK